MRVAEVRKRLLVFHTAGVDTANERVEVAS